MVLVIFVVVLLCITDSAVADCNVTNCDPNFCTDNVCTKCNGAYYKTDNGNCNQCFLNCRHCDDNLCYRCVHYSCDTCISNCSCSSDYITCPGCPDGYYQSVSVCYKCHFTDCKCSNRYGCSGCLPGKYGTSNYCQNSCPTDCIACKSVTDCTKCVAGKYSQSCQLNCTTTCQDGTCDKIFGNCSDGCPDHHYLGSSNTCKRCPMRCRNCTDVNHCTTCKKTYNWGHACQYDCSGCSMYMCDKDHGCSSGCDYSYYQAYSNSKHGYECIRCPETCLTCSSATYCTTCETGYWGSDCQQVCSSCSGVCHNSAGCVRGCKSAYYQRRLDNGFECAKCLNDCVICKDGITCEQCNTGFYSTNGTKCAKCSENCWNANCDQQNGTCIDGCISGWSGYFCDRKCHLNCQQCAQDNALSCSMCRVGFYGTSCESSCNIHCKQEDGVHTCKKNNGTCMNGCEPGYWGKQCNIACESGCLGSRCNETTGICLSCCKEKFYGTRCENEYHCESVEKSTVPCYEKSELQSDSQENNSTNAVIVALSVVTGIAILVAGVSITGNVILLNRRRVELISQTNNAAPTVSREHQLDNNDYQDLSRNDSADVAYSSITHEYENAL